MYYIQNTENKGTDQIMRMHALVCGFVVLGFLATQSKYIIFGQSVAR